MSALLDIPFVTTGRELERRRSHAPEQGDWSWTHLVGRLVELQNEGASSVLSFAFSLVYEAQQDGEPVAWISASDSLFYPPDVIENGIDLEAVALVRVNSAKDAGRAADKLLRSGAFGLVLLDLGSDDAFPTPLQNRLVHLADEHRAAVVCLTEVSVAREKSLGPMVSLRAAARRQRECECEGGESCQLVVARDKHRGLRWTYREDRRGPVGMR